MYKLDNRFTRGHYTVTVVGCGGTGGFVTEGLCRLLPPHARLVLIDHDRVEERNLIRQNFNFDDLGKFKSEALAQRLARRFNRPIAYSTFPVALSEVKVPGLVIGCVDNGPSRRDIAEQLKHSLVPPYGYVSWWIDAGNGENYGQVLIGNNPKGGAFSLDESKCLALPMPTIQRPEILAQAPVQERDCAQIVEQGPTINQAMASIVIEVVRRLIEGTCLWMQLYLDLEAGTLNSVLATPELVQSITGIKIKKMMVKGGES